MKKIVALLLAVMMVFALCACGGGDNKDDSQKTLVVGIDPEYPPYSYIGSDGEYTGFDIEVAQAACDLLGWKMEVFPVNWDNKLAQLDGKECDCIWSGMTILDSMKEAGYVISDPYYDNTSRHSPVAPAPRYCMGLSRAQRHLFVPQTPFIERKIVLSRCLRTIVL